MDAHTCCDSTQRPHTLREFAEPRGQCTSSVLAETALSLGFAMAPAQVKCYGLVEDIRHKFHQTTESFIIVLTIHSIVGDHCLYTSQAARNTSNMSQSSPSAPTDGLFSKSGVVFSGLSVIIAMMALVVGLLQLRRYRQRHKPEIDRVYELEAAIPLVN